MTEAEGKYRRTHPTVVNTYRLTVSVIVFPSNPLKRNTWHSPCSLRCKAASLCKERKMSVATLDRHDSMSPRLSVVAPCYNEEEGLPEFVRRVTETCVANVGAS